MKAIIQSVIAARRKAGEQRERIHETPFGRLMTIPVMVLVACLGIWQAKAGVLPTGNTTLTGSPSFPLSITSNGTYVINGQGTTFTTTGTNHGIVVASGVTATITLQNVIIRTPATNGYNASAPAAMIINGNGNNSSPNTRVMLYLEGNNTLHSGHNSTTSTTAQSCAAGLEVWRGATVSINDGPGTGIGKLTAKSNNYETTDNGGGAAGIGTGDRHGSGGNIIIRSGVVEAISSYHGAGIGDAWGAHMAPGNAAASSADKWQWLWNGSILIYGGDVTSKGGMHGCGIGGACYSYSYGGNGTVIVLPPAGITAQSATTARPRLGATRAGGLVYIGDPEDPTFIVRTADWRAPVDMFLDLHANTVANATIVALAPELDPARIFFGTTSGTNYSDGELVQHGNFATDITFYTEAKNERGHEYVPVTGHNIGPGNQTEFILNIPTHYPDITVTPYAGLPSYHLQGYDATEATDKAVTVRIANGGADRLVNTDVTIFSLNGDWFDYTPADFNGHDLEIPGVSTPTYIDFPIKLKPGLPAGSYGGVIEFKADRVEQAHVATANFVLEVKRDVLPPPVLVSNKTETNSTPFTVTATFDRPVSGFAATDIVGIAGGALVNPTPSSGPPATVWTFDVVPDAGLPTNTNIQAYVKENAAVDAHGEKTNGRSNVVSVLYNAAEPFPTFSFSEGEVFITAQTEFSFTVTPNGIGTGADDLLVNGTAIAGATVDGTVIEIRKDNVLIALGTPSVSGNTVTITDAFGEGAYEVTLLANVFENNTGNLMAIKVGTFEVRIPTVTPGDYPDTDPNIGYGITPVPTVLDFHGGVVVLTVYGTNLQYAEAAGILEIELPAALGGGRVIPHAALNGLTATHTVLLPGNNTVADIRHPFTLYLNNVMPNPDAVGYTTVQAALPITIDPLAPAWCFGCGQPFKADIPLTGNERDVTIEYLGLAKGYLMLSNGDPAPTRITLGKDQTELVLEFLPLAVPYGLEGGTASFRITSPGLPEAISASFTIYNRPNLDNLVYIPAAPHYAGLMELNIRGGSPELERSFDEGNSWELASNPVTPTQIANLGDEIFFREPTGCYVFHFELSGRRREEGDPSVSRSVIIPQQPEGIATDPMPGEHFVQSGEDFTFRITLSGAYAGMQPEVTTNRQFLSDADGVTSVSPGEGVFDVTLHAIREPLTVTIRTVADLESGIEAVEGPRVWSSGGQVYVYATLSGEAKIYTLAGALVKSLSLAAGEISSAPLATGFYVVVTLSDGKTYKVVVQ